MPLIIRDIVKCDTIQLEEDGDRYDAGIEYFMDTYETKKIALRSKYASGEICERLYSKLDF